MLDKSLQAVDIFNKNAKLYQDKFMDVNLYGKTFDFFCNAIQKSNADILELACGPGNITKYILDKRPDFNILATDLAPDMIALGQINNPTAQFQLMDCRAISSLQKKYDGLICGFCLPYLNKTEVEQLISDTHTILNPSGLIYLSTMEDDYEKSGYRKGSKGDEIFMHYYREAFLTNTLLKNNFSILCIEKLSSIMTDEIQVIDLIIIANKN